MKSHQAIPPYSRLTTALTVIASISPASHEGILRRRRILQRAESGASDCPAASRRAVRTGHGAIISCRGIADSGVRYRLPVRLRLLDTVVASVNDARWPLYLAGGDGG